MCSLHSERNDYTYWLELQYSKGALPSFGVLRILNGSPARSILSEHSWDPPVVSSHTHDHGYSRTPKTPDYAERRTTPRVELSGP